MDTWRPLPDRLIRALVRTRFSREHQASEVEAWALVYLALQDRKPLTQRAAAELLGWGEWRCRKFLDDVKAWKDLYDHAETTHPMHAETTQAIKEEPDVSSADHAETTQKPRKNHAPPRAPVPFPDIDRTETDPQHGASAPAAGAAFCDEPMPLANPDEIPDHPFTYGDDDETLDRDPIDRGADQPAGSPPPAEPGNDSPPPDPIPSELPVPTPPEGAPGRQKTKAPDGHADEGTKAPRKPSKPADPRIKRVCDLWGSLHRDIMGSVYSWSTGPRGVTGEDKRAAEAIVITCHLPEIDGADKWDALRAGFAAALTAYSRQEVFPADQVPTLKRWQGRRRDWMVNRSATETVVPDTKAREESRLQELRARQVGKVGVNHVVR